MRRLGQHPLGHLLLLAAALALLPAGRRAPADDRPPDDVTRGAQKAPEGYRETVPGSGVRFEMAGIPGGTFLLGSPKTEKGRGEDEGPQRPVSVRPFWMGRCEVTWDEFDLYLKASELKPYVSSDRPPKDADAITRPSEPYVDPTFDMGHDGYPVIGITHRAAMEYCRWLSRKTGHPYRLPTEAEWEWACRAGSKTAYFFGDDPKKLGEYAWYDANAAEVTHPVGRKKANPWGLYDILGNVAEWCLDHYDKEQYARLPADRAALGPVLLPTADRFPDVVRGGSWVDGPAALRSAARKPSDKDWQRIDPQVRKSIWWLPNADFVGFRVVRPDERDTLKDLRPKVTNESK